VKRFKLKQRVFVRSDGDGAAVGEWGTVVRLRRADNGAWVKVDRRPPASPARFPFPATDPRANHLIAYPEDCTLTAVTQEEP
jgi:hypothetical protein